MSRKPRLLLVNEASFLSTGYSTYGMEVMKRLHATGKYELAELAIYGTPDDPRQHELPWAYFGNMPPEGSPQRAEYDTRSSYEFGDFTFNEVCLKYRPDIVWDIRDHWMMEFAERSPFRPFYHWCIMPTVDAMPQNEAWLSTYMNADAVLTYSDWGLKVLEQEGGGLIKTRGSAPPCADMEVFVPVDKADLRRRFSFREDIFIVGTVMRNQPRKLYPQLIKDFARFIKTAPPNIALKTYLYLHTSYPDKNGWDIPRLIKQSGVAHKIIVTYRCKLCHLIFPALFQDCRGACVKCGSNAAVMPNVADGVDRPTLSKIINLFDLYVQYANSEGFGMPQVEASSCGVPVYSTDYSAMSDVVRKIGGVPIRVLSLDEEQGSGCLRARPDGDDFIAKLGSYFSKPESLRRLANQKARTCTEKSYSWDKTTETWMKVFDSLPLREPKATWDSPPRIHIPQAAPAEMPSNEAYVKWAITNVLGRPELVNSYLALRLIRDLNWGATTQGLGSSYFNEDSFEHGYRARVREFGTGHAYHELRSMCEYNNLWEKKRCSKHD
jgi:glycosyltransferase involved in cell wall biosynthesis